MQGRRDRRVAGTNYRGPGSPEGGAICPERVPEHESIAYGSTFPCSIMGGTLLVAQLVEALRYKPEGRGFDSRWCHWNFSLT